MARFVTACLAFVLMASASVAGTCGAVMELRVWAGQAGTTAAPKLQDFAATPLVDAADVRSVQVTTDAGGAVALAIGLKAKAARRLSEATLARIGEPMAIVHNGAIVSAPIVRDRIVSGRFLVTGGFSADEAMGLKAAITDCAAE